MWLYGWLLAALMTSRMSTPAPIRVVREFVGQGDVHVAIGRVGELGELGRLGAGHGHDLGIEHTEA